jgi:hypothetical protein
MWNSRLRLGAKSGYRHVSAMPRLSQSPFFAGACATWTNIGPLGQEWMSKEFEPFEPVQIYHDVVKYPP